MRSKPLSKWNLGLVVGLLILACGKKDENPLPATPPATFEEFSEGPEGCGNFVVIRANRTADRHISVNVRLDAIKDAVGPWDFELPDPSGTCAVSARKFNKAATLGCTDVIDPTVQILETWNAVAGHVHVSRRALSASERGHWPSGCYSVSVVLDHVRLRYDSAKDGIALDSYVVVDHLAFDDVVVGWIPG